jgi:probable rRNA maturation factor
LRPRLTAGREQASEDLVNLQKKVAGLNESTLERFVLRARKAVGLRATVNVLVTSSAAIRVLNRQFRNQNKATDVLSFAFHSAALRSRKRPTLAGDIVISADMARQNSAQLGHPIAQEIKVLALHGILHLAGFDHERDNGKMARKEANLRRTLRLPAALIERVHPVQKRPSKLRRGTARAAVARRTA